MKLIVYKNIISIKYYYDIKIHFIIIKMNNILMLLLIVLLIEITFEYEESTTLMNSLGKKFNKIDALVRNHNKKLQKLNITKSFLNCLNETSIIPNQVLRTISTKKSIYVTNDYEYFFNQYYNETIRKTINN